MLSEVEDALQAWNGAPLHIRAMAGQYVGPILSALVAIAAKLEKLEGAQHGA